MAHETTLYSVLRVSEDASADEIKQAYRKLVKLWHPDLNPDDKSAEKRMQEITEAYTVLSDQAKKWKYDEELSRKRAQLRAKQEQEARQAAAAAAASARAASVASAPDYSVRKQTRDPDYYGSSADSSDSYYEDLTRTPFVVNNPPTSPVREKPVSSSRKPSEEKHEAVEQLTSGEKGLEDLSIALCVIFPILIPIVHKHMKDSLELYPGSRHYHDAITSLRIVTVFALPLWALIITLIIKVVMGTGA